MSSDSVAVPTKPTARFPYWSVAVMTTPNGTPAVCGSAMGPNWNAYGTPAAKSTDVVPVTPLAAVAVTTTVPGSVEVSEVVASPRVVTAVDGEAALVPVLVVKVTTVPSLTALPQASRTSAVITLAQSTVRAVGSAVNVMASTGPGTTVTGTEAKLLPGTRSPVAVMPAVLVMRVDCPQAVVVITRPVMVIMPCTPGASAATVQVYTGGELPAKVTLGVVLETMSVRLIGRASVMTAAAVAEPALLNTRV